MSPERCTRVDPPYPDPSMKRKIQGLLLFRLLMGVFFLVLTLMVQSRREGDLWAARIQPLYFFSMVIFLFTIVAALSLKHTRNLVRFGYLQLFFDVEAVTVLIFLSGGIESLFSFLYMPVIISAALLLHRRGSLFTASMCSLSYGTLLDLQYFGWISPLQIVAERTHLRDSGTYFVTILMSIAGFYLVAYLSGSLAEELKRSSRQVEKQKFDLRRLEALHQNIVQSMSSGLLTIDENGMVIFCNRAAMETLGLTAEELRGRPLRNVFPGVDPLAWSREIPSSFSSPICNMRRRELRYQRPSGQDVTLGYTVSVLQEGNGEASGWIVIFQDLTHLKAMEDHVRRMERLAFAGKIAAEIAHEIKNPLAAMSGAFQMLRGEIRTDSIQSRLVNIVDREIVRIKDLVNDFLWLARGSKKPERSEKISTGALIQDVLALLKAKERVSAHQTIHTTIEASPTLFMDPHHLQQILWNLLVNALEAMPEGGNLSVRLSLVSREDANGPEARVDIRDEGHGIAPEIRDRVFEPFFTTKESGTGLGLSIVYQLVENAGGRIEVTHHDRAGTTFSLFFPIPSSSPLQTDPQVIISTH